MLRPLILLCIGLLLVAKGIAQTDLEKLVDTERAFARMAAEKGTRTAFLANMTDDALVFGPDKAYGKPVWSARADGTPGVPLLSWEPNYADISANGILGYTTGNCEFRPKGKDDSPSGFGEVGTVWLRQPDGRYKWVVDIGVGHPKPEKYLTKWTTSAVKGTDLNH